MNDAGRAKFYCWVNFFDVLSFNLTFIGFLFCFYLIYNRCLFVKIEFVNMFHYKVNIVEIPVGRKKNLFCFWVVISWFQLTLELIHDNAKWLAHELINHVWLSLRLNNQASRQKTNWPKRTLATTLFKVIDYFFCFKKKLCSYIYSDCVHLVVKINLHFIPNFYLHTYQQKNQSPHETT